MPDYSKGKIYRVFNDTSVYIGSTTMELNARLSSHRRDYKKENSIYGKTTAISIIGSGDYKIELIELYPCNSNLELRKREREWVEKTECINKICPFREVGELNEIQREKYKNDTEFRRDKLDRNSKWLKDNKEKRREYTKLKMRRLREKWKAEKGRITDSQKIE